MAFREIIEQRDSSTIYVDDQDTRHRRAVCYSRRKWTMNRTTRLYVPYGDEQRGADQDICAYSPKGVFRSQAGDPDFSLWDDGFNTQRGTKRIRFQSFISGAWETMTHTRVAQRYNDDGYGFRYRDAQGSEIDVIFIRPRGKWVYRLSPVANGRYRAIVEVQTLVGANQQTRKRLKRINTQTMAIEDLGEASVTWHWGPMDKMKFDWSDMIRTGMYASHTVTANRVRVFSRGVNWAVGDGPIIIDPVLPVDAGFSGSGDAGASDWGTDTGTVPGEISLGIYAFGNPTNALGRALTRFDSSGLSGASAINSITYMPYINATNNMGASTVRVGRYHSNTQTDPDADTYGSSYGWTDLSSSGERYVSNSTSFQATGRPSITLGSSANSDLLTAIASYSIVTYVLDMAELDYNHYFLIGAHSNDDGHEPQVEFDYTAAGGGVSMPKMIKRRRQFRHFLVR